MNGWSWVCVESKDGEGGGSEGASKPDPATRAYLAAVALLVRRDFAVGMHVRSGLRFPEGSPRGVDAGGPVLRFGEVPPMQNGMSGRWRVYGE